MPEIEGFIKIDVHTLESAVLACLKKAGVPLEEAELITQALIEADQRGVYTHGCTCLPRYIGLIHKGEMRAKAEYTVLRRQNAVEVWDGKRSNGQVIGHWAMHAAMEKAKTYGVGIVAVKGSNHFGAGAYYAQLAQKQGMIGVAMSTGASTMAPWGGADRLIGNNPIAVAAPTEKHPAVVLDMAQSVVAFGRISNIKKQGKTELPAGWALDYEGAPTQSADDAYTVLPMGQHKGFGAALMVDIISGILFDGATADRAGDDNDGPSCFFMALNIDAFSNEKQFAQKLDMRIDELKGSRLAPGAKKIYIPGEIEAQNSVEAQETIWMMPEILADIETLRPSV